MEDLSITEKFKSKLHEACRLGDIKYLETLVEGYNEIRSACIFPDLGYIQELLSQYIEFSTTFEFSDIKDLEVMGVEYREAITFAASQGYLKMVELLFAQPDIQYITCHQAFLYAVENAHIDIVKLFLDQKEINKSAREDAFQKAAECGHLNILKVLATQSDIDVPQNNVVAFSAAAIYGHLDVIKFLVTYGKIEAKEFIDALVNAFEEGHLGVVKFILEKIDGSALDQMNYVSVFKHAVKKCDLDTVEYFLSSRGIVSDDVCQQAFQSSVWMGQQRLVKLFLDKPGFNVAAENHIAIQCAAKRNHTSIVQLLITHYKSADDIAIVIRDAGIYTGPQAVKVLKDALASQVISKNTEKACRFLFFATANDIPITRGYSDISGMVIKQLAKAAVSEYSKLW